MQDLWTEMGTEMNVCVTGSQTSRHQHPLGTSRNADPQAYWDVLNQKPVDYSNLF